MKKIITISLFAIISIGCGGSAPTQVQTNTNSNTSAVIPKKEERQTVAAHTTETQKPMTSQSNTGNPPNLKAVDVSAMTATIEKAEKDFKAKPTDAKAKEILATAYFERAFALTNAAQYSAALGDFRKGLKLNPNDKEAKEMHDQIVGIYQSMKREVPKEGEEKAPLPIGK